MTSITGFLLIQFLASLLILPLIAWPAAHAREIKDIEEFEKACQEMTSFYQSEVKEFARQMKEQIAPTLVREKLIQALSIASMDAKNIIDGIGEVESRMTKRTGEFERLLGQVLQFWTQNQEYTLAGYSDLRKQVEAHRALLKMQQRDLETVELRQKELDILRASVSSIPEIAIKELTADSITLLPQTTLDPPAFTPRPRSIFEDPVARGWAIATASATVLAGFIVHATQHGLPATMNLFSFQADGTNMSLSSNSATGIGIIGSAVAVAFVFAEIFTAKAEEERQVRAKKASDRLQKQISETQEWYQNNRLKDDEYRSIGRAVINQESQAHGSQGIFFSSLAEIQNVQHHNVTNLRASLESLNTNQEELDALLAQYRIDLSRQWTSDYLKTYEATLIDIERISAAGVYFNEQVSKKEAELLKTFLQFRKDCPLMIDQMSGILESLEFHARMVDSFKTPGNAQDGFFSESEERIRETREKYLLRIKLCHSGKGGVTDVNLNLLPVF